MRQPPQPSNLISYHILGFPLEVQAYLLSRLLVQTLRPITPYHLILTRQLLTTHLGYLSHSVFHYQH